MPRRIDEEGLFDTVVELWAREGYTGMTTRAVAEHAGVNEATLFRRYGGKAELVVAALQRRLASVPLKDVAATGDLRSDLLAVVQAYEQTFAQVGAVFPLLLVEAGRHAELRPALQTANENLQSVIRVIVHHQAAGRLRSEDPMVTTMTFLGPLFVRGLTAAVNPGLPPLHREEHVDGFLVGRGV
jgi:AcrR family transcriptional regulator